MVIAKLLKRTFAPPPFGAHYSYSDKKHLWDFKETINVEGVKKFSHYREYFAPSFAFYLLHFIPLSSLSLLNLVVRFSWEEAKTFCGNSFGTVVSPRRWGPPGEYSPPFLISLNCILLQTM